MIVLLSSCGIEKNNIRIINNCRHMVNTYGDAIECMIQLDEAQRNL